MKISSWKYDNFKVGILYVNEQFRGIVLYFGYKRVMIEF